MSTERDPAWDAVPQTEDPMVFLEAVMGNPGIAMEHRVEAARTLLPYHHERLASDDGEDNAEG